MTQPQTPPSAPGLDELISRQTAATDTRLQRARTEVTTEIGRTDSKAAALLATFSLPLAVLVAAVPGRSLPALATALVCLGVGGLVAAMLVVLLVVRPRLSGHARGSYLHWATCTSEEVRADLAVDNSADHVVRLSQIATAKYRALKVAIDITAGALVLLALALAAALTLG
jgi:hypothetical protein